jgi:tetratricopeptide (TPR) repeat protein
MSSLGRPGIVAGGEMLRSPSEGDLPAALDRYRVAYAFRQGLAQKDPTHPGRQNGLAKVAILVADTLEAQKQNLDEAVKLYGDAIAIQDEARPRYDSDVFYCYIKIGDVRILQNNREDALTEYKRAWAIARDRAAGNTNSLVWQRNLATAYTKIGDVLTVDQRLREALESYEKALEIVASLAAKFPQSTEWPALNR